MADRRIAALLKQGQPGEQLTVKGWVRTARKQPKFTFVELNDGSCLSNLQIVIDASLAGYEGYMKKLSTGAAIAVGGKLQESPGKKQRIELHASSIEVIGEADPEEYQLSKKRHSFEFLRTIAHLRTRTNTFGAIARVRNAVCDSIHRFFQSRGFVYVHTPIITTSDCEGAGEMFQVTTLLAESGKRKAESEGQRSEGGDQRSEGGGQRAEGGSQPSIPHPSSPITHPSSVDYTQDFFGKPASLTVSGQLEAEIYATSLGNCYTFGPTFRAENSNTPRHLAEFWMIEPEMPFYDLNDNMTLAEEFIKTIIRDVLDRCPEDMQFFNLRIDKTVLQTLDNILDHEFIRLPYTEAVEILEAVGRKWDYPVEWGRDLQTEHERFLTEEHFKQPVILFDYPRSIKPFYMRCNDDGKTVRAMDVLVPRVGEIIGGSQREERYDVLLERITECGMNPDDYWWYLELRRFGTVPHSGFGLGLERMLLLITGMQNIRDVIPFPRTPKNAEF